MNEALPSVLTAAVWLVPAIIAILVAWWAVRRRRAGKRTLKSVLADIAFDQVTDLVIPKADEGEIQIDHLLLTAQGLLIIDVKEVRGNVFGSDKMEQWTVIGDSNRFTFSNPQPALYDRIAAVRQIVRQVPVAGRVVFLDGAEFSKGVPALVCTLDQLHDEFGERDKAAAKFKIEAFIPHWEQIRDRVA